VSARKHSVRVTILGEEYSLRTEASPEHVRALAGQVDETIRRLMQSGGVVETHKAAVLAALQLADDLTRARAAVAEATTGVRQLSGEVRRMLPPGKRGLLTPAEMARATRTEQGTAGDEAGAGDWFDDEE
jgi:cell division protein ZapA